MREGNPIQADTLRGAGTYGGSEPTHKTRCSNSNNAFGHSDECPKCFPQPTRLEVWAAARRASQVVPYQEPDAVFPESRWSDV